MGEALDAAQVALPAAAVQRRVAVQDLAPIALLGHADAVVRARLRREVADEQQRVFRPPALPAGN